MRTVRLSSHNQRHQRLEKVRLELHLRLLRGGRVGFAAIAFANLPHLLLALFPVLGWGLVRQHSLGYLFGPVLLRIVELKKR